MSELVARLQLASVSEYPDIHRLSDDVDIVLWVLVVAAEKLDRDALTASEISELSTFGAGRALTRQRAAVLLDGARNFVARVPRSKPARYTIMRAGVDRVRGRGSDVLMIDPSTAFTALQNVGKILSSMRDHVGICDPYVDDKTLIALTDVPRIAPVKLLTKNISDSAQFRRKLQAYSSQFGNVEVRVSNGRELHDRYIFDSSRMWLLGQSFNAIGKKQSFIVSIGPDVRALTAADFSRRWNVAEAFL